MEAELARYVTENDSRLPIVAFMAGRFMDEMPGMSFGHAGTIVEGKEDTATEKIARLAEAGIVVAEEISQIPALVAERIGGAHERRRCSSTSRSTTRSRGTRRRRQARRGLPGRHLPGGRRRASRSSPRTSTSACSAGSASTPRRPGTRARHTLYSGETLFS